MRPVSTRKLPIEAQYGISIVLVLVVAVACFVTVNFLGYKVVALILLMTVSLIAMLFDILPVLLASVLSAVTWNFFFIPPIFTFHIRSGEDLLLFSMYFLIAMVNAVMTFKIRDAENKAREKEEKEHAIKLYNTLLNSLSHELRTPIATILGAVDTLQDNKDRLSETNRSELLTEIDIASIRLNRQVENLLNMSRLESGMLKLNIEWTDINDLINSVIQKITLTRKHELVFEPDEQLPFFKLDAGLIEQVVQNIIHNAIQYTPDGTVVKIEVACLVNTCIITITDNGPGFPGQEITHVFEKFYRVPNTVASGSGLGLSIVKGFVEAHRGTVALINHPGGGARFTIHVPGETSFLNNLKNE